MAEQESVKKLTINEALKRVGVSFTEIQNKYQNNEDEYYVVGKLKQKVNNLFTTYQLGKYVEKSYVRLISKGRNKYYNLKDIKTLSDAIEIIEQHFFHLGKAIRFFGYTTNPDFRKLKENLKITSRKGILNLYEIPDYYEKRLLLNKLEIEEFLKQYISINEAKELYNVHPGIFRRNNLNIVEIKKDNDGLFLNRKYLEDEMYKRGYGETYSLDEVEKLLGLTRYSIDIITKELGIERVKSGYAKKDIEKLISKQERLIKNLEENYYTREEVFSLFGTKTLSPHFRKTKGTKIPLLARKRGGKFSLEKYPLNTFIYEKRKVDNEYHKRKFTELIHNHPSTNHYHIFLDAIEFSNVKFSKNGKRTKEAFFKFVKRKFSRANVSDKQMANYIQKFVKVGRKIAELTKEKELYLYSENELNLAVFNEHHTKALQLALLSFINDWSKSLSKKGIPAWNVNKIRKPVYNRNPKAKEIYSLDDFIALTDYVNRTKFHLKKALDDIEKYGTDKYVRYGSTWLYVLIHLTNGWRHNDVITTPRINLDRTTLKGKSIEWLRKNNLTKDDIEIIVSQLHSKKLIHTKTGKRRYFFCSDDLKESFAYAIAFCELRCQKYTPLSDRLVEASEGNQAILESSHNAFFKNFIISDFKFKSLKMNRTVISYIYSVIKKKTKRNPLEFSKVLRNHSDDDITSIYIDIPQEHLNYITNQLFNLGHFGYVYTLLRDLLNINNSSTDENEDHKAALVVKSVFGDFLNIEKISRFITNIEAKNFERNEVKKYLSNISKEELYNTLNFVELGLLPAKEEGVSCIFRECPLQEKSCYNCPFAIHHFVSLSVLVNRLKEKLFNFSENFNKCKTDGERTFLVNNLFGDIELLQVAIAKFGEKVVSEFILEADLKDLRKKASEIDSKGEYYTLPKGE